MVVKLNGKTTGIAAKVTYKNNGKKRFILTKENNIRLFDNVDVARTVAKTVKGIEPYIEYFIVLSDEKMFSINSCRKIRGGYKVYDPENETMVSVKGGYNVYDKETNSILFIEEKHERKVINFNYLVFEHGDTNRTEKKYGYKRMYALYNLILQAIQDSTMSNDEFGISKVEAYNNEIIAHIKGCTSKIHINSNSLLMDINQARKEIGENVFPFVKEMDKFTTFYVYISRDVTEPIRIESENKALDQLNKIVEIINCIDETLCAEVVPVNCKCYILLEE